MIISDWTDEHTQKFRNETLRVKHDLISTGLFSDEALSELLDKHPRDQLDVCAMSTHPVYQYKFRTGDVRGVDGKTLIEAVKSGEIWINMRKAMNIHSEYNAILSQMYGKIANLTGMKPINARGGILISSRSAKVPLHFDATETVLWHIRGQKKVILYPHTENILPDEEYENFMYKVTEDYLPHDPSIETEAEIYDLQEGEMITWALNRPHRVENQSYCISVTTEYSTHESSLKNAGMYTNAVLRQKLGLNPSWRSASKPEKYIKASVGTVLRKIGVLDALQPKDMVSFTIDNTVSGFIREIEPIAREF